ncbi:MAG: hypothetical protein VX694_01680 [Planctomycetota bacterium]|nr:hypothetical protein [Planctomycetota bacterium]
MEPFTLLLSLTPLWIHVVFIAVIRLSGRFCISTGGREIAMLAFAVSGLIAVGPVELFFPMAAAAVFGPMVWLVLALFYVLCISLIILGTAPKLVIYGSRPHDLSEPLMRAAKQLDNRAEMNEAGLQVTLPTVGIHLRIAGQSAVDHAAVIAFEDNLSPKFWFALKLALHKEVAGIRVPRSRGLVLTLAAILLGSFLASRILLMGPEVAQGFESWLWR